MVSLSWSPLRWYLNIRKFSGPLRFYSVVYQQNSYLSLQLKIEEQIPEAVCTRT